MDTETVPEDTEKSAENQSPEPKRSSILKTNKLSSSSNTCSSITRSYNNIIVDSSRSSISYINEISSNKGIASKVSMPKPKSLPKDAHKIVRQHSFLSEPPHFQDMQKELLGLLADFHSGKLNAFSNKKSMDMMTDIRQQQEKLARLHFELGGASDYSLNEDSLKKSQETMDHLVEGLEKLSMSIEGLQNFDH